MPVWRTRISLAAALSLLVAGVLCGVQIALYMYDYFDNGVADIKSLFIGIGMLLLALGYLLFLFRRH